ncbi:hypothetical protein D9758_003484 [Tetrapyrgos nigripes]|uniref:Nephrocystin 3-like N-terminal domain-containing protein n=1 Tax=Tetrapyrgos nigripes TaxID=182062 RepID=A0A8H5GV94_9AGAR|nr:hypothetical protein D9758_003484 [Tetrapyrgos nigripes]
MAIDSRPASVNVVSVLLTQLLPPALSISAMDYTLRYGSSPSAEVYKSYSSQYNTARGRQGDLCLPVAVINGKKICDTPWANECHWEVDFPIEPSEMEKDEMSIMAQPYTWECKFAWLVISGAYQASGHVLKNQHDRDGQLVDLYNLMLKIYEIATENDLYKQIGDNVVKQSKECSIFISNYGSRRYLYRILTGSEASTRIQDFRVSFGDLQKAFTSGQIDLTTRGVLEIKSFVLSQGNLSTTAGFLYSVSTDSKSKLAELVPQARPPAIAWCLDGTRQESLLRITNRVTHGEESVFWVSGVAGCGKSSLMGSMIDYMRDQFGARTSRLAAFIRFDRNQYNGCQHVV